MKKLWTKEDDRRNAQKLLDELLLYVNDLDSPYCFLIKKELSASFCSKEKSKKIDEGWIDSALLKLKTENKETIEDFEKIYSSVKASIHRKNNKPKKHWSLFIPFNLETEITKISVLGKIFYIVKKLDLLSEDDVIKSLKERIPPSKVLPRDKDKYIEQLPKYFLKTEVYALEHQSLWKEVEKYYDLIRGIVDFSMHHGVGPDPLREYKKDFRKRTFLELPDLAIARDENNELEVLPLTPDCKQDIKPAKLNATAESNFVFVTKLVSFLNDDENSIEALIADCLRLYGQAMDAIHDHQAFLSLWQLAERITYSKSFHGNSEEVARRLNLFNKSKLPGSNSKYVLKEFADQRNKIVHKGIHEVYEDEIIVLRLICEMALDWIMHNKDQIKTEEHLQAYYNLIELTNYEKEIYSFVEAERKKM
uniref:HEPN domain-containing protein n=1 Tax=Roseihalotalea indica TaxID=2867963 RepID=A0AA49JE75_9BACT|nr:HEPN domain-containing protein [Tunicatimonas sp. TK19036]